MTSLANGVSVPRSVQLQEELRGTKEELAKVIQTLKDLQIRKRELEQKVGNLKSELQLINETETSWTKYQGDSFSWSGDLKRKLRDVFQLEDFRSYQKTAINATMSGLDVILIMPTGGGKSLVFQLPAVLSKGITLVVSPLISLMEDQLQSLQALGISTSIFNSQTSKEETKKIFNDMIDPKSNLRLLYVTPEKLAKSKRLMSQLEKMYRAGRFARLVIDEVHCCSQWGHDFRKDYTFLGIMKTQYPTTPILGLTATATTSVILDVQKMLNVEGCLVFKDSFFRPNLKYEVRDISSKDKTDDIAHTIKSRFAGQSGIIYCLTIKDCEAVSSKLSQELGIRARPYHAQMDPELRTKTQRGWYTGNYQVIVATVAFGMGINKLDVRFVMHHSLSKSLENYYQETGRAGRDGEPAYCIAYYNFQDVFRATSLMVTEKTGVPNVYKMLSYCLDKDTCRKGLIAQHFADDSWDPALCTEMCDNCDQSRKSTFRIKLYPVIQDLGTLINHASTVEERLTFLKLMDSWFGKGKCRVDSVKKPKYDREVCERLVAFLLLEGYLKEEFHFNPYTVISYLNLGPKMAMITEQTKELEYCVKIKSESDDSSNKANKRSSSSLPKSSKSSRPTPAKKKRRISSSEEEIDISSDTEVVRPPQLVDLEDDDDDFI